MTIQQVIDAILAYHPGLSQDKPTCDGFKCGNPSDECRGIVTTCAASMKVIRKAIELGANLILVHELLHPYGSGGMAGRRPGI